jgi:hypothetical protein
MNIETMLYQAMQEFVSGRCFPDFAPEMTARPYITYQVVGGQPISFIDGAIPDHEFSRVQVNVWADTRIEASDLGRAVEHALRAATELQTDVVTGRFATYDETTQYRGTMQDFIFFT